MPLSRQDVVREHLINLSQEAKDLYVPVTQVPEVEVGPSNALQFHRDFVSWNRPVVFRGAIKHWEAFKKWNRQYLTYDLSTYDRVKLGDSPVTVAVTPTGYADAISPDGTHFVMPYEKKMNLSSFLDTLKDKTRSLPHYIQKQNSNLTDEFSELLKDVSELEWASEAFGKKPDAVNFWMGDERCVTSTHKDPYENIYCVVHGYKDIILHPPSDVPWLYYKDYPPAQYVADHEPQEPESLKIQPIPDMAEVPWISVDPLEPNLEDYPDYANASPVRIRVEAGDALYLPSLWFHHLRQSHGCIAVNFWYDMEYDCKYNYFNLVSGLSKELRSGQRKS